MINYSAIESNHRAIQDFEKLSLLEISNAQLSMWLKKNILKQNGETMEITTAFFMAKLIKEAHRLGVVRGQLVKPETVNP